MAQSHRSLPVVQPLVDSFARKIRYLRLSLTDRCNYRCTYCMPEEMQFLARKKLLTFEELEGLSRVFVGLGVRRIRLTGGEPTVRSNIVELTELLASLEGLEQLVMTTNGHLLEKLAGPLHDSGLAEVNVSLDTLDNEKFASLTRRGQLDRVIRGIDAAREAGLRVKLNCVALRRLNRSELADLCSFSWQRSILPRFIEQMPMSGGSYYDPADHLPSVEIRSVIGAHFGQEVVPVDPGAGASNGGPSRYWALAGNPERVFGVISAMSEHFCDTCNRLRLSATGELHTCLAYDDALNLRDLMRSGASDDELRAAIRQAVVGKRLGHEFQLSGVGGPAKAMIGIGG